MSHDLLLAGPHLDFVILPVFLGVSIHLHVSARPPACQHAQLLYLYILLMAYSCFFRFFGFWSFCFLLKFSRFLKFANISDDIPLNEKVLIVYLMYHFVCVLMLPLYDPA